MIIIIIIRSNELITRSLQSSKVGIGSIATPRSDTAPINSSGPCNCCGNGKRLTSVINLDISNYCRQVKAARARHAATRLTTRPNSHAILSAATSSKQGEMPEEKEHSSSSEGINLTLISQHTMIQPGGLHASSSSGFSSRDTQHRPADQGLYSGQRGEVTQSALRLLTHMVTSIESKQDQMKTTIDNNQAELNNELKTAMDAQTALLQQILAAVQHR
ncbi:hypothetical protein FGO68_gene9479 [Halteria grandinella]|uniref:Uncharacterized protein n=1 Tax=Halteria grandinella TaxID=5974 RepID=A0A8J8NIJ9_HALGN|nr:hypothetical protein FGO68_gene9479 [Halteria grandinella]